MFMFMSIVLMVRKTTELMSQRVKGRNANISTRLRFFNGQIYSTAMVLTRWICGTSDIND